jgi:hypothetical protein
VNVVESIFSRLKSLFEIALTVVCFYYLGGFSIRQSILLGVFLSIIWFVIEALLALAFFEPYAVQVFVNYDALRNDLGFALEHDPDEKVYTLGSDQPERELFIFTALTPTVFAHHRCYVYNTVKELNLTGEQDRTLDTYRKSITFGGKIPGTFKFVDYGDTAKTGADPTPQFFFEETGRGYVFGIRVVPEWWEVQSKKLNESIRPDYDGEIVFARIPLSYFPYHLRKWERAVFSEFFYNWQHRRLIKQLTASGWTVREDFPYCLEHRYLVVSFDEVVPRGKGKSFGLGI